MENLRKGATLVWDGVVAALAVNIAFRLRFGFIRPVPFSYTQNQQLFILALTLIFLGFGLLLGTHGEWGPGRALSQPLRLGLSAVATSGLVLLLDRGLGLGVPLEVVAIVALLLFSLSLAGRLIPAWIFSFGRRRRRGQPTQRRAVIYGAGELGCYLVEKLRREPEQGILPIAFADDNPRLPHRILGLRVLGGGDILGEVLPACRADLLIIAINHLPKERLRALVATAGRARVMVQRFGLTAPTGGMEGAALGEINLEELLRREEVSLNMGAVEALLRGRRVLVTGAAGSIGSELCRQALRFGAAELILFDFHENGLFAMGAELGASYPPERFHLELGSVRDEKRLDAVMARYRPELVLHAAAHKHVPMMELSPEEAVKNNVFGTRNVAAAAIRHGAERFLLISTDKAVNPTSIMGATKRVAELLVQSMGQTAGDTRLCAVRFGNVLGSNGSVVPTFRRQIAAGGPVTVTHPEMRRFFMTIPEAVQLVLEAVTMAKGGEIFVLAMGEPVKIYDLACDMIRLSGLTPEVDIPIVFTGTRPGEKLYEELSLWEEEPEQTQNKKITINHPALPAPAVLEEGLRLLAVAAGMSDPEPTDTRAKHARAETAQSENAQAETAGANHAQANGTSAAAALEEALALLIPTFRHGGDGP